MTKNVSRAEFLNLFAAVFVPMFMAAVDQTLLATATPAITTSLGGLRDLHLIRWIGCALFDSCDIDSLRLKGALSMDEARCEPGSRRFPSWSTIAGDCGARSSRR